MNTVNYTKLFPYSNDLMPNDVKTATELENIEHVLNNNKLNSLTEYAPFTDITPPEKPTKCPFEQKKEHLADTTKQTRTQNNNNNNNASARERITPLLEEFKSNTRITITKLNARIIFCTLLSIVLLYLFFC